MTVLEQRSTAPQSELTAGRMDWEELITVLTTTRVTKGVVDVGY